MIRDYRDTATRLLNEKRQMLADNLTSGTAPDYADYRHKAGMIRGIDAAKEILNETLKEMQIDDD